MPLSDAIRERRLTLALTQHEAAAAADVSMATWNKLETGRAESATPATQRGVCRALGWTPESFASVIAGGEPTLTVDTTHTAYFMTKTKTNIDPAKGEGLEGMIAELVAEVRALREDVNRTVRWSDIEKLQTPNEEKKK